MLKYLITFILMLLMAGPVFGSGNQGDIVQVGDGYLGSAATRAAADDLTGANELPDSAAIIAYGDANWSAGGGFWTQATDDIYYTDGKVAIGTTDFTGFHRVTYIYGTSTTNQSRVLNVVYSAVNVGTGYAGHFTAAGAGVSNVGLYASASGSTFDYAGIFENGSVGIGTTSPDTALEVVGVITATAGTSTNWNTAYSERLRWDGGSDSLVPATALTSLGLDGVASAVTAGAYFVGVYDADLQYSTSDTVQEVLEDLDFAISNPTIFSEVKTGRVRYNSTTGVDVTFALPAMDDTDYDVFITNWSQVNVNAGIPSIESKLTSGFTLKASGSNTTGFFEYYAIPYTLRGSTQQQGTDTFNSTTGVTVALAPNLADTDYNVIISLPAQTLIEDIGVISVESKAVNQFVVKNSGDDAVTTFNWLAVPYTLGTDTDPSGTDNFAGSGGVTVDIVADVGSLAYVVLITPETQVGIEDIGVISIESKSQTTFDVMNSGDGTTTFAWRVFPQAAGAADMYRSVYDVDLDGTIDLGAGGLAADLSGYAGLLKISGGTASYITDSSTDWDTAYTHSQNATGAVHGAALANTANMIVRRGASGEFSAGVITATLTGNASTATLAATVTIADNESTNETNAVVFLPGGDLDGGDLALESDGTFHYNPSSGTVTATTFVGALTGTATLAAEATILATARSIGGTSFDGSAAIPILNVTVADTTDTTAYVALWESASGAALLPKSDAGFTYNAGTGVATATGFIAGAADFHGDLTGDVSGNVSGTSGSTTGNAASATILANARTIGGTSFDGSANIAVALASEATILATARNIGNVSFDGSANITPATISVTDESADTESFIAFFTIATGAIMPKTGTNLTFNSAAGVLTATGFAGALTGAVTGNVTGDLTGTADYASDLDLPGADTSGDVAYFDGSNWVRLATDAGKYLKAGTPPSWDTPAGSGGDITAVIAGSGLTGGATSGDATLNIGITDGSLTVGADSIAVATGGIGPTQLASTAVTPGVYTNTNLTVDGDGRITAAATGSTADLTAGNGADITANVITVSAGDGLEQTSTGLKVADGGITESSIAISSVVSTHLDVSNNPGTGKYLRSDGDGSFTWDTPSGNVTGDFTVTNGTIFAKTQILSESTASYFDYDPNQITREAGNDFHTTDSAYNSAVAYLLTDYENSVKTAIYIENYNAVNTYQVDPGIVKQISSGIHIRHFSDVDNGGDSSGIVSTAYGFGNAATFQKYLPDGSGSGYNPMAAEGQALIASGTPISRQHGYAVEVDTHGNQTGMAVTNWSNGGGLCLYVGVGNAAGSEGIRILPQPRDINNVIQAYNPATHGNYKALGVSIAPSQLTVANADWSFYVQLDGDVWTEGQIKVQNDSPRLWLDEVGTVGANIVLDGGLLQVQRRAAGFGSWQENVLTLAMSTGDLTIKGDMTAVDFIASGNVVTSGNVEADGGLVSSQTVPNLWLIDTNDTSNAAEIRLDGGNLLFNNRTSGGSLNRVLMYFNMSNGKLTVPGGVDPPYVLYDRETRQSIYVRAGDIDKEKQGGAMMFFNSVTNKMETFVASTGTYSSLDGTILEEVEPL